MRMSTDHPRPDEDGRLYHLESSSPEHNHDMYEQMAHITPHSPPASKDKNDDDEPTLKLPPLYRKKPPSATPPVSARQPQLPVLPEIRDRLPAAPLLTQRDRGLLYQRKYRQLYLRHLS